MTRLFGPVRQLGYLSNDAMQSMRVWYECAGIGPWYYFNSKLEVTFEERRSTVDVMIAFANTGPLQIELIEQRNDAPSAFRRTSTEQLALHELHHYAFWPANYEESVQKAQSSGFDILQTVHVSRGRVTYWRSSNRAGPIIELAESTEARQRTRDMVALAAQDWAGDNPFRSLD